MMLVSFMLDGKVAASVDAESVPLVGESLVLIGLNEETEYTVVQRVWRTALRNGGLVCRVFIEEGV